MYSFDETRNLYLTIAKGYKSGGFNTQIFSDVLQQKMMNRMGIGEVYDVQRGVAYKPEYSWNYEIGGHFSCMEARSGAISHCSTSTAATSSSRSSPKDRSRAV